jgi:TM2 domain-containing membrane protein YozV
VSQEWYYSVDGDRQGPISAAELKKLAEGGNLKAADLVWKEGMADWAPAKSIKGLFTTSGAAAPAAATPARIEEPARAPQRAEPEDDERPSARGRRRDPDDEDDRPSGRMRRRDPDDDPEEEERPARRRDDDDNRPRKKSKRRAPEDAGSNKMTVALIALITGILGFGWIGIHKFMLGKTTSGLIMLLGSVLTCFIGAIVFNLISIIEGIIYLTKSDEEFYETYVVGDKEWF